MDVKGTAGWTSWFAICAEGFLFMDCLLIVSGLIATLRQLTFNGSRRIALMQVKDQTGKPRAEEKVWS
jgi:hypothetical protein